MGKARKALRAARHRGAGRHVELWLARRVTGMPSAMTDDAGQAPQENPEKDRSEWVTGDEPMTGSQRSMVRADDVRRLLACPEPNGALVVIKGRIEVATPAELDLPEYRGALQVATRREVVQRAGGDELSDRELAEQAEDLDTAVRNLGA